MTLGLCAFAPRVGGGVGSLGELSMGKRELKGTDTFWVEDTEWRMMVKEDF